MRNFLGFWAILPLLTACHPSPSGLWVWKADRFVPSSDAQSRFFINSVLLAYDPDCPVCLLYTTDLNYLVRTYSQVQWNLIVPQGADTAAFVAKFSDDGLVFKNIQLYYDPQNVFLKQTGLHTTPQVKVFNPKGQCIYNGKIDNRVKQLGIKAAQADTFFLTEALRALQNNALPNIQKNTPIGCIVY